MTFSALIFTCSSLVFPLFLPARSNGEGGLGDGEYTDNNICNGIVGSNDASSLPTVIVYDKLNDY